MYTEEKYLNALIEFSSDDIGEKNWLLKYFELYKSTLNWPKDLPPIERSFLSHNKFKENFNRHYLATLNLHNHFLNNETHSLHFLDQTVEDSGEL
jgi:hypothetical protein